MAAAVDLTPVRLLLEQAGYSPEQQAVDFPVWLEGRNVARLNLVGFGRASPRDMTTATVVCEWSRELQPSDQVRAAANALAAPVVLTATDGMISVWPMPNGGASPLAHGNIEDSAEVIQLLRPEQLLAAKIGHRQFPLFPIPVDLLQSARADRAARLEPLLLAAFTVAADHYDRQQSDHELAHKQAARLVIGALTTLVLRDKNDLRYLPLPNLLDEVASRFARNFDWMTALNSRDHRLLMAVLHELGDSIDYTSLDPTILAEVYGRALVADEERAELGIHYTPPDLARRLLAELPVEVIAPEERHVLDPACGSGTLLIAAHDRLRSLQPADWADVERHEDLRVHLRGIDVDPLAAEIARLALLLNAMPAGNGWHIENRDSLQLIDADEPFRPSIIVANPPWRYRHGGGEAVELADQFVTASVHRVRPGGLIALLLPQSWLDSKASAEARELLRSTCELFEAWRLPLHTFPTSNARAAAVLARKRSTNGEKDGRRLLRVVRPNGLVRFTRTGQADESYILPSDDRQSVELLPGPLSVACAEIHEVLEDVAYVLTGPQPKPGIRDGTGSTLYLDSFRDVSAFDSIKRDQLWRVGFPEEFQTARGASLVARQKVLISALRFSEGPWCVKAVLDRVGVAVRNSVHMVSPKQDTEEALFALFAFVGSGFFNCWIDEHALGVNIPTRATRSVPLPFGAHFVTSLSALGEEIAAASTRLQDDRLHQLFVSAEEEIWKGFRSVPEVRSICARRLAGWAAPEGRARYEQFEQRAVRRLEFGVRRFGYVMEVVGSSVRLWINGLTDDKGLWVDTPKRMPGFLLREGTTFDITDYGAGLESACFRLQAHSYHDPLPV